MKIEDKKKIAEWMGWRFKNHAVNGGHHGDVFEYYVKILKSWELKYFCNEIVLFCSFFMRNRA